MLSEALQKELARLQKEREQIVAELSGLAKSSSPEPAVGSGQAPEQVVVPPAPSGPTQEEVQAHTAELESRLKDVDDKIRAREAELKAALEMEKDRDDALKQTNAAAGFAVKMGDGHDHVGHAQDPLGTMIIGGIAAATVVMEAVEPVATMVEGAMRRGEDATLREAAKQSQDLDALHQQHNKDREGLTQSEIYQEAPAANKEIWLVHQIQHQSLEEQAKIVELQKRDPKAFEINKNEREDALQEQAKIREQQLEQVRTENAIEAEKLREQAAQREHDRERESESVQKPQWKDAERAEKQRCEMEIKKLHQEQELQRQAMIDRLGKKVADGTIGMDAVKEKLEEQRKAFEKQEKEKRDEQRDRADRIELLYRGPPSERGGL